MIRLRSDALPGKAVSRLKRRQMLRRGFLGAVTLAVTEFTGVFLPFFGVIKIEGLGATVAAGRTSDILTRFQATNDEPLLFVQGRFFLLHVPGGIAAAYRKCTHLGCTVPWIPSEDQFHCPCHGSLYEKRTGVVLGGPAPRPLDLFRVREENGVVLVDTDPSNLLVRKTNAWDPAHLEVRVG
ncbi:MAG: ubiquinol-cytochrome c reductase iron-sulfur subunit [Candidatus Limnocylindria bacterium]